MILNLIFIGVLWAGAAGQRTYSDGRAFPSKSLEYVKQRFKEINDRLTWDNRNYLEKMAANYSSCNYDAGIYEGYALIPTNESWVSFIEYQNISGNTAREVIANLAPVVDNWVERKRWNTQIIGASIFGCSVSPGCGRSENRMGISCVFSPSSPMYIPGPDDYEDEKPPHSLGGAESSNPIPLNGEQYLRGELVTGSKWERSHFLENLSRLETNCAMKTADKWDFDKSSQVIVGMEMKLNGVYGKDTGSDLDSIFLEMKAKLPPNVQIGCTMIPDCKQDDQAWMVVSCLYEERCRRELCF